jgi:hypothetical protein
MRGIDHAPSSPQRAAACTARSSNSPPAPAALPARSWSSRASRDQHDASRRRGRALGPHARGRVGCHRGARRPAPRSHLPPPDGLPRRLGAWAPAPRRLHSLALQSSVHAPTESSSSPIAARRCRGCRRHRALCSSSSSGDQHDPSRLCGELGDHHDLLAVRPTPSPPQPRQPGLELAGHPAGAHPGRGRASRDQHDAPRRPKRAVGPAVDLALRAARTPGRVSPRSSSGCSQLAPDPPSDRMSSLAPGRLGAWTAATALPRIAAVGLCARQCPRAPPPGSLLELRLGDQHDALAVSDRHTGHRSGA